MTHFHDPQLALFRSCSEFSDSDSVFGTGSDKFFTCATSLHGTVQILSQIAVLVYESIQISSYFTAQTLA